MRLLVVDDFGPWRRFAASLIRGAGWEVAAEASDGLEAVEKAQQLQPHVVLLDIGLPKLSGIEAARRIREVAPDSRILFASIVDSLDVILEALNAGATGYLVKLDAGRELVTAIEAASHGQRFVSSRLRGHICLGGENIETSDYHAVQFYSDDPAFVDRAAAFIGAALKSGKPAVVILTKPHRDALLQQLRARGIDIDALIAQGTYIVLDAAEALSMFMVNDWPDAALFFRSFSSVIESASKAARAEHPRVALFGEGVALLCANGNTGAAIRLEQLANELRKAFDVDILCAYPFSLRVHEDISLLAAICAEHSAVYWG